MEAVTEPTAVPARQRRPRRQRSLTESLLSIVLGLEAVLVFFIALAVYGLHALPPLEAFGGGAALVILLALATRVVRYSWGVWVGWVLQALLLATGIVLPALYIAAALFVAMWIFCFVRARQIEHANRLLSDPAEGHPISTEGTHP
jgi:Protein of unknown function (DUF4233)